MENANLSNALEKLTYFIKSSGEKSYLGIARAHMKTITLRSKDFLPCF